MIDDLREMFVNRKTRRLQHIYKEGNKVAHEVAKLAMIYTEEKIWIEESPIEVFSFVLHDKVCNDCLQ